MTFSTGLNRVGNTITNTITQYTDALARAAISLTTSGTSGVSTYNSTTGVFNIPQYQAALTNPITGTGTSGQVSFWNGTNTQTGDSGLTWDNTNKRLNLLVSQTGVGLEIKSDTAAFTKEGINIVAGNNDDVFALRFATFNESKKGLLRTSSAGVQLRVETNHSLSLWTNNTNRWQITNVGVLQSTGAQTIQTSSDDLTLQGTGLRTVFGARTRHTPITAPTTGLNAGDMYYDSATNRMRFRRTSDWVEMGMLWDTVGW